MEFEDYEEDERPTKGQRKREAEALQKLGETLVQLSPQRLREVPMPPELAEAVVTAQGIRSHGARRRQLQLIGKLMRQIDPAPIQAALDRFDSKSAAAIAEHHQAERWRERLLNETDTAVTEFLDAHPGTDSQRLRQLIRSAQQELAAGKPPKSSRDLFRLVREAIANG